MEAQSDFKELLVLFNAHQVEYMIVGAGSATPKSFLPSFRAKGEIYSSVGNMLAGVRKDEISLKGRNDNRRKLESRFRRNDRSKAAKTSERPFGLNL